MSVSTQIREEITAKIVASLEQSVLPWRRPWRTSPNGLGRPANVISRNPYRGINVLLTQLHAMRYGFSCRWFGTFEQIKNLGGKVKKRPDDVQPGEWGCKVVFYRPLTTTITDEETGEDREKTFPLLRLYTVFSIDQCEGEALDKFRVIESPDDAEVFPDFGPADELIAATGADIRYGGEQAYYARPQPEGTWPHHKTGDHICVPHRNRFLTVGSWYETVLHELSHWSELRTGWDRKGEGYAAGELVAELAATFLAGELHIPQGEGLENHAAYLQNWLKGMKADPSYIFKASTQASKVCDFLMAFANKGGVEPTPITTGEAA